MHQQSYNYTEFLEDTASHFDLKGVAGRIKTWKIRSALHQCHVDFLEVERKITFGLERVAGRILQCNNYPPTFYNQFSQRTQKKKQKTNFLGRNIGQRIYLHGSGGETRIKCVEYAVQIFLQVVKLCIYIEVCVYFCVCICAMMRRDKNKLC